jgi:CMP-2-keto-3-deoxyoctulosonic acid synthetase
MPKSKQEKIEGLEQHRRLQHDKEMQKKAKKQALATPVKHGPKH